MENIELGRFFDEMARISALSLCVRTLRSTAPTSKNEGSAHPSARRVARTILPRKKAKTDPQISPKSIEVGRSGYVEAPKSIEVGHSWTVVAAKVDRGQAGRVGTTSWHARPSQDRKAGKRRWVIIVLIMNITSNGL